MKTQGNRKRLAVMIAAAVFVVAFGSAVAAGAAPIYHLEPAIDPSLVGELVEHVDQIVPEPPVITDGGGDEACFPEDGEDGSSDSPGEITDGGGDTTVPSGEDTPTVDGGDDGGDDDGDGGSEEETPTAGGDKPDRNRLPFTGGNDIGWAVVGMGLLVLGFAVGATAIPSYNRDRNYRY
ncbi:MAG: hypothetical protein OEV43_05710 [Coriobacteriia bacterium]|nr:hypothetical protein [Coriobacteriia bacterium]